MISSRPTRDSHYRVIAQLAASDVTFSHHISVSVTGHYVHFRLQKSLFELNPLQNKTRTDLQSHLDVISAHVSIKKDKILLTELSKSMDILHRYYR